VLGTVVLPLFRMNVMLDTDSLKVALTVVPTDTPVAPDAGEREVSVGAVVSPPPPPPLGVNTASTQ